MVVRAYPLFMNWDDVDVQSLREAVRSMGPTFHTKDVSEQEAVRGANPGLVGHGHWHSFGGRALSEHRLLLHIESIGSDARRGEHWRSLSQPPAAN